MVGRPRKSNGQGRPAKLTIYVPENLYDATAADREAGLLNDKLNRVVEAIYANGGGTEAIDLQINDHESQAQRHMAIAASLKHQRESVIKELQNQVVARRAEEQFIEHLQLAIDRGLNIAQWAHPDRKDVQAIGWNRAKQIIKEHTKVDIK